MARDTPQCLYNVNNSPIKAGTHLFGMRVRWRKNLTLHRFFMGFNFEGVSPNVCGGRTGYGAGSYGGTIRARLCSVDGSGFPVLGSPLASETVQTRTAFDRSKALVGVSCTQLLYVNFGGVSFNAGDEAIIVITNSDGSPTNEWFSVNSPVVSRSAAGPHDANTRDVNATGAINGLQPTEAAMWSVDNGASWGFGHRVGGAHGIANPGGYYFFTSGDDACKIPWYGWTEVAGDAAPRYAGQPYTAYPPGGRHRLTAMNAKEAVTLTKAGGYAAAGKTVGVLRVKNLTTLAEATTPSLGSGKVEGDLSSTIAVSVNDDIEISQETTGAESTRAQGDSFIINTFQIGDAAGDYPLTTKRWGGSSFSIDEGRDAACLWVKPWPYFPVAPVDPGGTIQTSFLDELLTHASLQSVWAFNEGSGTVADDAKGSIDGTYVNTPTFGEPGLFPSAPTAKSVRLVAASDEHITFGDNYDFPNNDNFTVGCFLKHNAVDATSRQIFNKLPGAATDGWQLLVNSTQGWRFFRVIASSFQGVGSGAAVPSVSTNYFVVVTYDGADLRLYINGTLADTGASAGVMVGNTGVLTIGNKSGDVNTGSWDGWIQYAFICNDNLGGVDIADLYTASQIAPDTTKPTFQSATIDGNIMVIKFSEALDEASIPAGNQFTIKRNGNTLGSPTVLAISNESVSLQTTETAVFGDTWTVAYTKV